MRDPGGERLRQLGGDSRPDHGTADEESARRELHHASIHRHRFRQYMLAIVAVLATFTVILGITLGTAGFVRTTQLAESNQKILLAAEHDRMVARDGICTVFEKDYAQTVTELKDTYAYLIQAQGKSSETQTLLYQFVTAGLPRKEADARNSLPPQFCEEPGIGSPKPFPKLPSRPANLTLELP